MKTRFRKYTSELERVDQELSSPRDRLLKVLLLVKLQSIRNKISMPVGLEKQFRDRVNNRLFEAQIAGVGTNHPTA